MLLSEMGGERSSKRTLSETEVLLEFLRNTKVLRSLGKEWGNQQKYLKAGYSWREGDQDRSGWTGPLWEMLEAEA